MKKNIIKDIINMSNKSITSIILEINQQVGCSKCISRDIIYRWINQDISESKNKRLDSIIYFCLYFELDFEAIEEILIFLKIIDQKQKVLIISSIENLRDKEVFIFNGYDSLQLTNFVKELEYYNINSQINLTLKDNITKETKYFKNTTLTHNKNFYIRDTKINNILVGGDNATQGLAINNILLTFNKNEIEMLLTETHLNHFNLYMHNNNIELPINTLFQLNQIEHILAIIKKKTFKICPFDMLKKLLIKKISLVTTEHIYEAFRTLKTYFNLNKCSLNDIYQGIYFLEQELNKIENKEYILIKIYIIESLSYLAIDNQSKSLIWKIAYNFFITDKNISIQHPHILWAFVVLLDSTKQFKYDIKHKAIVLIIEKLINDYCIEQDEFNILQSKLNSLKVFFNI